MNIAGFELSLAIPDIKDFVTSAIDTLANDVQDVLDRNADDLQFKERVRAVKRFTERTGFSPMEALKPTQCTKCYTCPMAAQRTIEGFIVLACMNTGSYLRKDHTCCT